MFSNLVESSSHTQDFKRRGSFFLGTFIFYAVLLAAAGVGSIYAYNVHLDDQQLEIVAMMRFPPLPDKAAPEKPRDSEPAASRSSKKAVVERTEISINVPVVKSGKVANKDTPEVTSRMPFVLSHRNTNPDFAGGPVGPANTFGGSSIGGSSNATLVRTSDVDEVPPASNVAATPQPTPERKTFSLGVINGKAVSKPAPLYPPIAKAARASGTVTVQILVDEHGRVISAHATNGHPLLRQTAVQAAYQARFSPTLLSKQPVKVSGFITYNFVLQ